MRDQGALETNPSNSRGAYSYLAVQSHTTEHDTSAKTEAQQLPVTTWKKWGGIKSNTVDCIQYDTSCIIEKQAKRNIFFGDTYVIKLL